jgi:hypothetical protein
MTDEKRFYQISKGPDGNYFSSSYGNKKMLDVFKASGEERGEKIVYRFSLNSGMVNGSSMKIANFLKELNEKKETFTKTNKSKLLEIIRSE